MQQEKKKGLTREQARELYNDMRKALATLQNRVAGNAANKATAYNAATNARIVNPHNAFSLIPPPQKSGSMGSMLALTLVTLFASMKLVMSTLEYSGIGEVPEAKAALAPERMRTSHNYQTYSQEEISVLKSLDQRRADLEERENEISLKEKELKKLEDSYATKMVELRDLTQKLKIYREKDHKKRNSQLDQLANVYSSMNPEEAAELMEQLDVVIALSLIKRMPEKRIGQVLSAMQPERALAITKMLTSSSLE